MGVSPFITSDYLDLTLIADPLMIPMIPMITKAAHHVLNVKAICRPKSVLIAHMPRNGIRRPATRTHRKRNIITMPFIVLSFPLQIKSSTRAKRGF